MRLGRIIFWLVAAAVAAPAIALTATRLADPVSGPAVRTVSFTPLAVPIYAAVAVLLGIALVLGRGGPRKLVGSALVVVVAGLGLHVWWLSPLYVGDTPAPAADSEPLVVMNTNLYAGGADAIDVVRAAAEHNVDVLVAEEVTHGGLADMEEAGLAELFPYRIGEPDIDVHGTMVFSRLPLGEPTRLETLFQAWHVTVGEGDETFELLAVHPVAPVSTGQAKQWRAEHALVRAAAERYGADLVVGDMNATLDHRPLRELADAGWRDSVEVADDGWHPTWPANGITPALGLHPPPVIQIDHVLVGPRMTAIETRTVQIPGTDHRAVVATVARR